MIYLKIYINQFVLKYFYIVSNHHTIKIKRLTTMKPFKENQSKNPEQFKRIKWLSLENFQHLCRKVNVYLEADQPTILSKNEA
jgi:hypothetical protein